jgi:hypothetical protein
VRFCKLYIHIAGTDIKQNLKADARGKYLQMGAVSPEEVREGLGKDKDSPFADLAADGWHDDDDMDTPGGEPDGEPKAAFHRTRDAALDRDDDIEWITVNGNHIPIKPGQSKEEAVEAFIEKKGEKKGEKAGNSGGKEAEKQQPSK